MFRWPAGQMVNTRPGGRRGGGGGGGNQSRTGEGRELEVGLWDRASRRLPPWKLTERPGKGPRPHGRRRGVRSCQRRAGMETAHTVPTAQSPGAGRLVTGSHAHQSGNTNGPAQDPVGQRRLDDLPAAPWQRDCRPRRGSPASLAAFSPASHPSLGRRGRRASTDAGRTGRPEQKGEGRGHRSFFVRFWRGRLSHS